MNLVKYTISKIYLIIFLLFFIPHLFSINLDLNSTNDFFTLELKGIGELLIPNEMEIQNGPFLIQKDNYLKNKFPSYEVSPQRIIAQPKGINEGLKSAKWNYARILFVPEEFKNINLTNDEVKILDKSLKDLIESSFLLTDSKVTKWLGTSPLIINGNKFLKTSYNRQMSYNPEVHVDYYYFCLKNKGYSITYSYRIENKDFWEPIFQQSINSINLFKK